MKDNLKIAVTTSILITGGLAAGVCGIIVAAELPALVIGAGAVFATKKAVQCLNKEDKEDKE